MRINVGRTSKKTVSPTRRIDLMAALDEIESREKARLKIAISYGAAEKVNRFLKEKGLPERRSIPMLIEYGLPEESEEELQKLESERESQMGHNMWGTCAVMKFKAYGYFMENKYLVMKLSLLLSENRSLKKRLETLGMQGLVPKDEWDDWSQETVDDYFRKYIFTSHR